MQTKLSREERVAFNKTYFKQIIRASGLSLDEFCRQNNLKPSGIKSNIYSNHLPSKTTYDEYRHVFPLMYYCLPTDRNVYNRKKGNLFREARLKKGWTVEEVASMIGIHPMGVQRYEQMKVLRKGGRYQQLAELLGITEEYVNDTKRRGVLLKSDVWAILESPLSHKDLSEKMDVPVDVIRNVRKGKHYKKHSDLFFKLNGGERAWLGTKKKR